MVRRLFLWLVWAGFIAYVFLFAPPFQSDNLRSTQFLVSGQFPWINPVIISLFSMIGILILIYSCLIFADGRMQQLPAWVFIVGSLGLGVVSLIPYLALREPSQQFSGSKDGWLSLLDSRSTGMILAFSTFILLAFAIFFGDWSAFMTQFQTNRFIHAMTIAFGLFCLLFPYPTLLNDDMSRRGLSSDSQFFWLVALVPLFGPLLYLCLRPPLRGLREAYNT